MLSVNDSVMRNLFSLSDKYDLHSRELKTLHLKSGIQGFHNKIMALIFIYKAIYITRFQFFFSFLNIFTPGL